MFVRRLLLTSVFVWSGLAMAAPARADGLVADHESADLSAIPAHWIQRAKQTLRIAYSRTSHGSQITTA